MDNMTNERKVREKPAVSQKNCKMSWKVQEQLLLLKSYSENNEQNFEPQSSPLEWRQKKNNNLGFGS